MKNLDKTSAYDYDCPENLIATEPADSRDESRLLVADTRARQIEHRRFFELPDRLRSGDLLVFNNTKVVRAKLEGKKTQTGGAVELLVLDVDQRDWWTNKNDRLQLKALTKSSNPPKAGMSLTLFGDEESREAEVVEWSEGISLIDVETRKKPIEFLEKWGDVPLPPYIRKQRRKQQQNPSVHDEERYQTVYASEPGSVAAPTAGLHFTDQIFDQLAQKGIKFAEVTLDVGPGTFQPVRTEKLSDHDMHAERYSLQREQIEKIQNALEHDTRVIAVGTTTTRVLESEARRQVPFEPGSKSTDLFIKPPFEFRVCDGLITNFHLPESTLLALVAAFTGYEFMKQIYDEAISEQYRLYSYGDSMIAMDGLCEDLDGTS